MFELTHPVELRDEQLDLVAAGRTAATTAATAAAAAATKRQIGLVNVEHRQRRCSQQLSVLSAGIAQGVFN